MNRSSCPHYVVHEANQISVFLSADKKIKLSNGTIESVDTAVNIGFHTNNILLKPHLIVYHSIPFL